MKLAVLLATALVLQNAAMALLHLAGAVLVKVDVGVLVVAFLALRAMPLEGAVGAFFVGYFVDLLSGHPTGLYAFLAVLTFLVVRVAMGAIEVRGPIGFAAVAALTSMGHGLLAFLLTAATDGPEEARSAATLAALVPTAVFTALVSPPVFGLLKWIESRFTRAEPGLLGP